MVVVNAGSPIILPFISAIGHLPMPSMGDIEYCVKDTSDYEKTKAESRYCR